MRFVLVDSVASFGLRRLFTLRLSAATRLGDPARFNLIAGFFDIGSLDGIAIRLSEGRDDGEDEYDENYPEGDERMYLG